MDFKFLEAMFQMGDGSWSASWLYGYLYQACCSYLQGWNSRDHFTAQVAMIGLGQSLYNEARETMGPVEAAAHVREALKTRVEGTPVPLPWDEGSTIR